MAAGLCRILNPMSRFLMHADDFEALSPDRVVSIRQDTEEEHVQRLAEQYPKTIVWTED